MIGEEKTTREEHPQMEIRKKRGKTEREENFRVIRFRESFTTNKSE